MADDVIQVELCAPSVEPVCIEATQVVAPGAAGVFTVLPGHTHLLTTLTAGIVLVHTTGGQIEHYAVSGGFAEVLDNRVNILAPTLDKSDTIDRERAQTAHDRAQGRLNKKPEDLDVVRAEAALDRAMARLGAHSREED